MALNMFIPVLLVLGAPVTLLLRALEPAGARPSARPRAEWVQSLMHSKFTTLLSNAMIALAVFVVSLYGLYFFVIVRSADPLPLGAFADEHPLPAHRVPFLLGHHRRRSGAKAVYRTSVGSECCLRSCHSTLSSVSR